MRSKWIQNLARLLVMAIGAGAGAALAFLCLQVHRLTSGGANLSLWTLVLMYGGMGAAGTLTGYLLSPRLLAWCSDGVSRLEKHLDNLSMVQIAAMFSGLVAGLLLAALLSQVLAFMGDSMFTLACSALLYLVLGATGLSIGRRRTDEFAAMLTHLPTKRERHARHGSAPVKLLDASVLQDGRIEAVWHTGFLEGDAATADYVVQVLQQQAEGPDEAKRQRARRALDLLRRMQTDETIGLRVVATEQTPDDPDTALLRLARDMNAVLLTGDAVLQRAAKVADVRVLNLNDLACALRMVAAAGDTVMVRITREGREAGQGVGYLEDGSMIVVENGRSRMGQTVTATVTSVLQTSAGRMVFARADD